MIDLKEILVANLVTMMAMWFLLRCRRKNRESICTKDKLYDGMCLVNFFGALCETISFLIDGRGFAGGTALNFLTNSLCFLGTVSIGLLWALYVDLRVHRNHSRTLKRARFLVIPWVIEAVAIVCNLFGTGVLFTVSEANVYHRGVASAIGYVSLMIYFVYSLLVVFRSKKEGLDLHFFPVQHFVGPCLAGLVVQFLFYGITTSWLSTGLALMFVQMQTYAENLYKDELSGLFNRRYLNRTLENHNGVDNGTLYGIMLDINDFKSINDNFGHHAGDQAICIFGDVLLRSIPEGAVVVRYAGDEFIILMPNANKDLTALTMDEVRAELACFNKSGTEPFQLHAAMGCAKFRPDDNEESFLRRMDEKMYEEKLRFHSRG